MPDVTQVLVRLPLTDEQELAFESAINATGDTADGFRAIGTPVSDSGMETVAWGLEGDIQPGKSFMAWSVPPCAIDACMDREARDE